MVDLPDFLRTLEPLPPLPLSPIEGAFWRLDKELAGAYRGVVLFRLDGLIEARILTVALRHLQHRHPKLRASVVQGDDGRLRYYFNLAPPPIPFQINDYEEEELPWREDTRRLFERGFPANGPLVAITVLRRVSRSYCEILLMAHHAIADGLSVIMLGHDLLAAYARAEAQMDQPPPPPLPAVTADHARFPGGWLNKLWLVRRFLRMQRLDKRLKSLPHTGEIPSQSQWVHWVFTREDTTLLVRRCRREQTSLSGVLVSAVCCGIMDCLPVPVGLFKCQFALDVRKALQGPSGQVTDQDLGCFVSVMNEFYEVSREPEFWTIARQAHRSLEDFVKRGGPSFSYNLAAAAAGSLRGVASRALNSESRLTLLANNYGVINVANAYGSLHPRQCTLTFNNQGLGPSLVIQGLVMGQRMNVGLAADGLDPAFWERLRIAIWGRLRADAGMREDAQHNPCA
jgi:hypothetical protein